MGDDRPILVCGAPRSGTTMLQLMLHAHPRIAIPPETRFVLESYRRRREFSDLSDPARRQALAEWITHGSGRYFADLGLDADEVTEEIVAEADTLGTALGLVFRAYARRFGKPRWGDKRPAYVRNLPALVRLFPDAQFVHIVRDGRDCVTSLTGMPWHRGGINQAISAWAQAVDQGRWARRALGPASYHEVCYERLVTDPESELRALCAYLGEEYDPVMAAPERIAGSSVPARKKWHARTRQPVGSDRVGRWATQLTPAELGLCEAVLGQRLRAQGYRLSGAPRPPAALRLSYERHALRHLFAPLRRTAVRAADRLPWTPPIAARL